MISYRVGERSLLFVETAAFTEAVRNLIDDETYRGVQNELAQYPEMGSVIPGCGGIRKVRVGESRRGKGKRGGCRVIYLHIPEAERIDLLAIYSKDKYEDLAPEQRKDLKVLATRTRWEATVRSARRKGH